MDQILSANAHLDENSVLIDQIDDDNTINGFGGGSSTGLTYRENNLTLGDFGNCDGSATNCFWQLDESWTPQWDGLQGYWRLNGDGPLGNGASIRASKGADALSIDSDNTLSYGHGPVQGSLNFTDGDAVTTSLAIDSTTSSITVSAWVYATRSADELIIWQAPGGGSHGWWMRKLGSGHQLRTGLHTSTPFTGLSFTLNKWQHVAVVWNQAEGIISSYLNGREGSVISSVSHSAKGVFEFARMGSGPNRYFEGGLDEVAIWDVALTSDQIQTIFNKQSLKHVGSMESRIIDSRKQNSSWTTLSWLTRLPFGKELPQTNESSADYSSIVGSKGMIGDDDLLDGIEGIWHLNGEDGILADDSLIRDSSTGLNDLHVVDLDVNNTINHGAGILKEAIEFDGPNDYLESNNTDLLDGEAEASICFWMNFASSSITRDYAIATKWGDSGNGWLVWIDDAAANSGRINTLSFSVNTSVGVSGRVEGSSNLITGYKWDHYCAVFIGATSMTIYKNGKQDQQNTNNIVPNIVTTTESFRIAHSSHSSAIQHFKGKLDEVAVWSRGLQASEVLQLYRRGINDIKYQVRSCNMSNCQDQNTLFGHGWYGPGGEPDKYFSELFNDTAMPPSMGANEGLDLDNNRYFQYRVIMESNDENGACLAGENCFPELESVKVGPSHSYQN